MGRWDAHPAERARATQKQSSARVAALSPCDDVALLEVERGNFKPASIGDSKKVATGEAVVTLGFPGTSTDSGSDKLTVTRGIVSKTGDKLRIDFTRTFSDGSAQEFFAEVTLQ